MSDVQEATTIQSERYAQWCRLRALPIYRLPPELVVSIMDQLEIRDIPAVIFGMYHLLRRHGIAPILPSGHIVLTEGYPTRRGAISAAVGAALRLANLPEELFRNITSHWNLREKVAFVLALLTTSRRPD